MLLGNPVQLFSMFSLILTMLSFGLVLPVQAGEEYTVTEKTDTGTLKTTTRVIKKKPVASKKISKKKKKPSTNSVASKDAVSKDISTVKTSTGLLKTTTIVKSSKAPTKSKPVYRAPSKSSSTSLAKAGWKPARSTSLAKTSTSTASTTTVAAPTTTLSTASTTTLASSTTTSTKTPWWQFWKKKNTDGSGTGGTTGGDTGGTTGGDTGGTTGGDTGTDVGGDTGGTTGGDTGGSTGGDSETTEGLAILGPSSLRKGVCSYEPFYVSSSTLKGVPPAGTSMDNLSLSSSVGSNMSYYSDANCTKAISSVMLAIGFTNKSQPFYIMDKTAGGAWSLSAGSGTANVSMSGSTLNVFNVVQSYGAKANGIADDTLAFENAIIAASNAAKTAGAYERFESGPGKAPQSIVYVPKGIYRVLMVDFKSNVRMEIDAAAEFRAMKNTKAAPTMFNLDAPQPTSLSQESSMPPLKNVSMVGVGTSTEGKFVYPAPAPSWDVSHSFIINDDPIATGVEPGVIPIYVRYVDGFLLQNIYSIQNNSDPENKTNGRTNSNGAVIVFKMSENSPAGDENGSRYDAHNGTYINHYNIHSPGGYGPNQMQTATNMTIADIFSEGGVTLRMETDQSTNETVRNFPTECTSSKPCKPKYGAMLYNITAKNIHGYNCNAGVYFAAHGQINKNVSVADVKTNNCNTGISQSSNTTADPEVTNGAFLNATLNGLAVLGSNVDGSGTNAQDPNSSANSFSIDGKSSAVVAIGNGPQEFPWSVNISQCTYAGDFSSMKPAGDSACVKSSTSSLVLK